MLRLSLESLIGDEPLDFNCPECGHKFKIKVKQVIRSNSAIVCPNCQININVEHDETTKKALKDSEKALKEFEKTLKKFGK